MGQRALNPLVFTTALPNQIDPALNPLRTPRTGVNNSTDGREGEETVRGSRNDQLLINDMDSAVGGLQAEDTTIDAHRTAMDSVDLQQQVGQRGISEHGAFLDLIA
ncbi:MAG: hypothetical protein HY801_16670 [Candidatus Lindowbacteria bacterium]|nr:hypothetical protein [Candidatus Lindowbacteria bacterium]